MAHIRLDKNKFQQWCADNGLTAGEVAERIGISRRTVYSYFSGERLPSRKTMRKMEKELGIDAKEMF